MSERVFILAGFLTYGVLLFLVLYVASKWELKRLSRELEQERDRKRTVAIPLGGVAGDSYDVVAKCHQCDLPIMVRIVTSLSGRRG